MPPRGHAILIHAGIASGLLLMTGIDSALPQKLEKKQ